MSKYHICLSLLLCLFINSCENKDQKPNILIIHFDDLSLTGLKIFETPNKDALASEPIRFENAYANNYRNICLADYP